MIALVVFLYYLYNKSEPFIKSGDVFIIIFSSMALERILK
jgi:hypothetical protein